MDNRGQDIRSPIRGDNELTQNEIGPLPQEDSNKRMDVDSSSSESAEQTWTWKVQNIHQMTEYRVYSDYFTLLNHKWRMLMFPKGNSQCGAQGHLSLYIEAHDLQPYERVGVKFTFFIVHPSRPELMVKKDSEHRFTTAEADRGFGPLIELRALGDYMSDNTFNIEVLLESLEEGTASSYFYSSQWDSKKKTGFVGLRNQGATCYMNSLLQSLFNIPRLRWAVYQIPTEQEESREERKDNKDSIGLALQRVFFNLQSSQTSVSTKDLTASFGWDSVDSFTQHDVQEFCRVLCDSLEDKMKKTSVDGFMAKLFEGQSEMYVECIKVDYKSKRTESFLDLALNVKGCRTLEDSFKQYIEVETLDGDNLYRAEQYGPQPARKGVRFLKFPPVLQLQLKRFEYDPRHDAMVKINDRFEFPTSINLDQFLSSDAVRDPADPAVYYLHSVLVHSGSVHGGHYYSYIRPIPAEGPYSAAVWYKFDDDSVYPVKSKVAVEESYGGPSTTMITRRMGEGPRLKLANAYMLVYMRESEISSLCANRPTQPQRGPDDPPPQFIVDLPDQLRNRFAKEEEAKLRRAEEMRREAMLTSILMLSDADLTLRPCGIEFTIEQPVQKEKKEETKDEKEGKGTVSKDEPADEGKDLTEDIDEECIPDHSTYITPEQNLKVERTVSLIQWAATPAGTESIKIPRERTEYWWLTNRENNTRRPNNFMRSPDVALDAIPKKKDMLFYARDIIFDQMVESVGAVPDEGDAKRDRAFIIFKYWDVAQQTMCIIGSGLFPVAQTCGHLMGFARALLGRHNLMLPGEGENAPDHPTVEEYSELDDSEDVEGEQGEPKREGESEFPDLMPFSHLGLIAFEEETARKNRITRLNQGDTISAAKLRHGDIVVVQRAFDPQQLAALKRRHLARFRQTLTKRKLRRELSKKLKNLEVSDKKAGGTPKGGPGSPQKQNKGNASKSGNGVGTDAGNGPLATLKAHRLQGFVRREFFEDIPGFLRYLATRVHIQFRDYETHKDRSKEEKKIVAEPGKDFVLQLSKTNNYDEIVKKLGAYLRCDPFKIRLRHDMGYPRGPIEYELNRDTCPKDLSTMIAEFNRYGDNDSPTEMTFFYTTSEFSFLDFKTHVVLPVLFLEPPKEVHVEVLVPRNGVIADLVVAVRNKVKDQEAKQVASGSPAAKKEEPHRKKQKVAAADNRNEEENDSQPQLEGDASKGEEEDLSRYRVVNILENTFKELLPLDAPLTKAFEVDSWKLSGLRVELIPEDELHKSDEDRVIWVSSFYPGQTRLLSYGYPLSILVRQGDKVGDFKKKVQARFGIDDTLFPKLTFFRYMERGRRSMDDDNEDLYTIVRERWNLAIENPEHRPKKKQAYYNTKAIKITSK